MRFRSSMCVMGVVLGLLAASSAADTTQLVGTAMDGDWTTAGNWDNGVPTSSDRAVIPVNAGTIFVFGDDVEADTIVVGLGASVFITSAGSLTLDNDDHNAHTCDPMSPTCPDRDDSIIDGAISIDSGAALILTTSTWHTFNGLGHIAGSDDLSAIVLGSGVTMTNNLSDGLIRSMTVGGFGTFNNATLVDPGSFAHMIFACGAIDDVSGAEWNTGCESILEFYVGSQSLAGDFIENDFVRGEFIFHEDVKTCGTFEWNCGFITLTGGAAFEYVGFVDHGGCGNPGVAPGFPPTCNDPFRVGSSVVGLSCFD